MADIKVNKFPKGWYFKQQHLLGMDGIADVNNFVIYKNAIEKVHGWKLLPLTPFKFTDIIDTFPNLPEHLIDTFNYIINSLNDSFLDPSTMVEISYPLTGPHVQSIFEYLRHEEEDIQLGTFGFDYIRFFGLLRGPNYNISFNRQPSIDNQTLQSAYGVIFDCDTWNCLLPFAEFTYSEGNLRVGPAIRIDPDSTYDNFTGYAAIYDAPAGKIKLGEWTNDSLSTYSVIIAEVNAVLVQGDIIKLEATDTNEYQVSVNGTPVIGPTIDLTIDSGNRCVGAVMLE